MMLNSLMEKSRRHTELEVAERSHPPSDPPLLTNATRTLHGPFRFTFHLPPGTHYRIEAGTNLQQWQHLAEGKASEDCTEYADRDAFKFGHRFYRVRVGTVASKNVIGYTSVLLPPGFSMIANPFEAKANTVSELFQDWPEGTVLSKFDAQLLRLVENRFTQGKWAYPQQQLLPGQGAIVFNPSSDYKLQCFTGNVPGRDLVVTIPAGFSAHSSPVPLPGDLTELGFPIANGDVVHLFNRERQSYTLFPYEESRWTAGVPRLSVGEAFWVAKTKPGNWLNPLSAAA